MMLRPKNDECDDGGGGRRRMWRQYRRRRLRVNRRARPLWRIVVKQLQAVSCMMVVVELALAAMKRRLPAMLLTT